VTVTAQPTTTTTSTSEPELDAVVADRRIAADGVVVLTLREAAGGPLPPWEPGAHVDLLLPGNGDGPLVRQYSLCGDPTDRHAWQLGVLREPDGRGGSAHVHDALHPGSPVRVRGPRNHFPLLPARRYLFVAGGIGITPIRTMVAAAQAAGAEWELVYGGRTRTSMAFLDELPAARVSIRPQDETGLLDLEGLLGVPRADTLVYCCGPEALLAAVEERCASWPAGSLRVERFTPKPVDDPVLAGSFEVELERSGLALTIPPGRSILDVVEEAGVSVLSSCSEGTCGTCETAVLAGEPDHRDSVLTDEEQAANDCMMICVSRSRCPRLVLDL
jgi:ferredoxin-NADP reductase